MPEITFFGAYVVAALFLAGPARRDSSSLFARLIPLVVIAIVIAHGWLLWLSITAAASTQLSLGNTLSLSGLWLALLASPFAFRAAFRGLVALFLIGAGVTVLFTDSLDLVTTTIIHPPIWQIISHAVMATLAYSLLAAAAILSILTALKDRRLRQHPGDTGWTAMLPSLEALERHMFAAITVGFALLSLAMFSGLVFVRDLFQQHLTHKLILTTLAWLVFAVLLFGRWQFGWRGRKSVNWTLTGFSILALAYFGSRIVLELILGRQWG